LGQFMIQGYACISTDVRDLANHVAQPEAADFAAADVLRETMTRTHDDLL
jgi:hypothetical protein